MVFIHVGMWLNKIKVSPSLRFYNFKFKDYCERTIGLRIQIRPDAYNHNSPTASGEMIVKRSHLSREMNTVQFFVLGLVVFIVLFLTSFVTPARIITNLGEVEGKSYKTSTGKDIFTFLGVPYSTPPTGKYRFDEPRPTQPWIGVWFALNHGPPCMQTKPNSRIVETFGKEDCLYLNIYTPSTSNSSNLPVLVYFHGGAFMYGRSSKYRPDLLMENHNIVYISVSYRVGPFGFLSTEDDVVPGNNGLKDQALALKWIQENIEAFGGDKTKVTISGNSAGGASVQYHYLSALTKGMFDKGISSSGSALVPWALAEKPLQKTKMLANSLGCPTVESREMVDCLKQRPTEQILSNIESLFMPWMYNPFSPFGPVVEINSSSPFLGSHPYVLLARGDIYDRPWLASVTTEEGLYPVAIFMDKQEHLQKLNNDWTKISPHLLDFNYTVLADDVDNVTSSIKNHYLSGEDISVKTQGKIVKMVGDRLYLLGMDLAARLQASSVKSDVFFYMFAYRGESSVTDDFFTVDKKNVGVSHYDDMLYLIDSEWTFIQSPEDKAMQLQLTEMWASFIKTGRPSFSLINLNSVSKDSKTTGMLNYLLIKSFNDTKMVEETDFGNKHFWNSLDLNENSAMCKSKGK